MDVQIVSTEIIKPCAPTPHHLRNFKLSFLDQTCAPFYIPLTLFYNTKFDLANISETHGQLKKSLSETLTLFYPLAGRVQDLFTIDCNDEGVSYTEAKANFTLSEFLQEPDLNSINKFLPRNTNVLENDFEIQMSIQVSVLGCGELVIGACLFHRVVDITTMASFLRTWANFCRGTGDKEVTYQDLALGPSLFPPLSTFPGDYLKNNTNYLFYGQDYSLTRRFVFDASAIATLRAKATSEAVPKPSRIEALTGFISERLMAGLESAASKNPPPTLIISHAVNIRKRFEPPLADTAFGNLSWFAVAFYSPSEPKMELPDYVEMLREVLQGINGESLRELEPKTAIYALSETMGTIQKSDGMREYKFTSWCNMGFYDLDFGWGRPAWVAHMGDAANCRTMRQFLFIEGRNAGEIELWILFGEEDMAMLENDPEFTAFATPNPSISL
ncbi:hypothetical protein Pfo_015193 [Paulownia fortunei]|nr:hypothetical protein Pfo_015193 [Paulownia fortunei]